MGEQRRLRRYVGRVDAVFQSGRLRGRGQIRNLSKEGLFIQSDRLPETGAPIALTIETDHGEKIDLNGTVRWTTAELPSTRQAIPGFGVRIESRSEPYRDFFQQILLT